MTSAAASRQHLIVLGEGTVISLAQSAKTHDLKGKEESKAANSRKLALSLHPVTEMDTGPSCIQPGLEEQWSFRVSGFTVVFNLHIH